MKDEISSQNTAIFLQWAGFALIVIFSVSLVVDVLPIALLQPVWLVQFSDKVVGGGSLALTGVAFLVLALRFDPRVVPLSSFQQRIGGLTRLVALVFLLLIPLQTIAGFVILHDHSRDIQRNLTQLQQATELISLANSETALIKGLELLPGAPKLKEQKLSVPFTTVKTQMLRQLNHQIPLLQTRIEKLEKLQLNKGMTHWFKQAVISAVYALAFWTLGRSRNQSDASQRCHPVLPAIHPIPVLQNLRLDRRDPMEIPPEWLASSKPADRAGKA